MARMASKPCSDRAKTLFLSQCRLLYIKFKVLTRLIRINRPVLTRIDPFWGNPQKIILRSSQIHQIPLR